jgi:hypothetical protein
MLQVYRPSGKHSRIAMGSPEHSKLGVHTGNTYSSMKYSLPFMSWAHVHDDRTSASCARDVHISDHDAVRAIEELPEHVLER